MIRKRADQAIEHKCIRDGIGEVEMHKICESVDELYGKGRLFNRMIIAPGNSIGEQWHHRGSGSWRYHRMQRRRDAWPGEHGRRASGVHRVDPVLRENDT